MGPDANELWSVLADLPDRFVAKANHGSGFNLLVDDKAAVDQAELRASFGSWLETSHGARFNESWYDQIPRKLIVERYLHDDVHGVAPDYKLWCFRGRATFVQVRRDRFAEYQKVIYDIEWRRQPWCTAFSGGPDVPRPSRLDDLIAIAERLAAGFDFIRVDLYCVDDRDIVFGEMTVAPGAGLMRFCPEHFERVIGDLW